jgi:hypothetical protein
MPIFARRRPFVADLVRRNVDIIVAYFTQGCSSTRERRMRSASPFRNVRRAGGSDHRVSKAPDARPA